MTIHSCYTNSNREVCRVKKCLSPLPPPPTVDTPPDTLHGNLNCSFQTCFCTIELCIYRYDTITFHCFNFTEATTFFFHLTMGRDFPR